jgi:DNA replication protein DnaC
MDEILKDIMDQTGRHIAERTPEKIAEYEHQEHERTWLKTAERIGVPQLYWVATVENSEPRPVIARITRYLTDGEFTNGRCLILGGPTRSGKTHAAVLALRSAVTRSLGFCYFPGLIQRLMDYEQRSKAMAIVQRDLFVVLNDLGVEYRKDGGLAESFVEQIIWHREANRLPTVITTNLTWDQLKQTMSERIIGRLMEWGSYYKVLQTRS